jgi:hypothetical protein
MHLKEQLPSALDRGLGEYSDEEAEETEGVEGSNGDLIAALDQGLEGTASSMHLSRALSLMHGNKEQHKGQLGFFIPRS